MRLLHVNALGCSRPVVNKRRRNQERKRIGPPQKAALKYNHSQLLSALLLGRCLRLRLVRIRHGHQLHSTVSLTPFIGVVISDWVVQAEPSCHQAIGFDTVPNEPAPYRSRAPLR